MVVDTSALVAIAFEEPERSALIKAIAVDLTRLVSAATLVECLTVFGGKMTRGDPRIAVDRLLSQFFIEVRAVDEVQWRLAGDALLEFGNGRHKAQLNFGDSFAYALAKSSGEPLLFKRANFSKTDVAIAPY